MAFFLLQPSPGRQLFMLPERWRLEGPALHRVCPHDPTWPGQRPTLEPSLTHTLAEEQGERAGRVRWGLFLSFSPPIPTSLSLS